VKCDEDLQIVVKGRGVRARKKKYQVWQSLLQEILEWRGGEIRGKKSADKQEMTQNAKDVMKIPFVLGQDIREKKRG